LSAVHSSNSMTTTVLISSVGRRGQLLDCFRQSFSKLGLRGHFIGVDCSRLAPAAYLVDLFFQVPRCDDAAFLPRVLALCKENKVNVLVPIIDAELALYAEHREEFAALGTTVIISDPKTIEVSLDKLAANRWLVENGFPAVRQATPEQVFARPFDWQFPLIAKPRRGSASVGICVVHSLDSLRSLAKERNDLLVEEMAGGREHTVNVLADKKGRCVCAVPHIRLETRAGEVSKCITVKHAGMMELTSRVAEKLPGAYGPLNIQGFLAPNGEFRITEINPRFGGGYPLAYKAGADFPRWLMEELLGIPSSASFDGWQDGLTMLRYDTAVFLPSKELGNDRP